MYKTNEILKNLFYFNLFDNNEHDNDPNYSLGVDIFTSIKYSSNVFNINDSFYEADPVFTLKDKISHYPSSPQ